MTSVYVDGDWKYHCSRNVWKLKYCDSKETVTVTSIDVIDGECTINAGSSDPDTCIAESVFSLTGTGIVSYEWSVANAEFADGVDVTGSSVAILTDSDSSERFTVFCIVNGVLQVYEEFRHQRWLSNMLVPSPNLFPDAGDGVGGPNGLYPGNISPAVPV